MLQSSFVFEEKSDVVLYRTESLRDLNQQLTKNILNKIEILEGELLNLTDLLMADGDLLQEGN